MITQLSIPPNEKDHHLGSLHALVVLVEYGDFECPSSAAFAKEMDELLTEFQANICYIFRHFPLTNIHPNSLYASLAAESAEQQNEFWNMIDLLFKNYDGLSPELIDECAEGLSLNMHRFKKDLKSEELLERITKDFSSGVRSGVRSTPTIFLNGHGYTAPINYELLRNEIEKLINEGQVTFI